MTREQKIAELTKAAEIALEMRRGLEDAAKTVVAAAIRNDNLAVVRYSLSGKMYARTLDEMQTTAVAIGPDDPANAGRWELLCRVLIHFPDSAAEVLAALEAIA